MGVTQLDRNATFLFFRKAIGVGSGQRSNEGGLAVINMAGGAENQVVYHASILMRSRPPTSVLFLTKFAKKMPDDLSKNSPGNCVISGSRLSTELLVRIKS